MKRINLLVFLACIGIVCSSPSWSQTGVIRSPVALSANTGKTSGNPDRYGSPAPDSRGWSDPAIDHNRLLISDGVFQLIGPYKVKGSQYLLAQRLSGDIFSEPETAYNITIGYNTYNQELEFLSTSNPDKPLIKEPGDLDSFRIHANAELGITAPIVFVYGSVLGSKDKSYFQVIEKGARFSLYKRYKSEMGLDPDNYAESSLRQFDLVSEYFYFDTETKSLKKIKASASTMIKEFKSIKDLSSEITEAEFTSNPEATMQKAIQSLNAVRKAF